MSKFEAVSWLSRVCGLDREELARSLLRIYYYRNEEVDLIKYCMEQELAGTGGSSGSGYGAGSTGSGTGGAGSLDADTRDTDPTLLFRSNSFFTSLMTTYIRWVSTEFIKSLKPHIDRIFLIKRSYEVHIRFFSISSAMGMRE